MRANPVPQEIYKHFKGKVYQIITLAKHSESGEQMVVYQQLYAPYEVYVRPLEMFLSEVDKEKYPDEIQKYRFERLELGETCGKEFCEITENQSLKKEEKVTEEVQEEFVIDSRLMAFLDTNSYERKLELLELMHPIITNEMIDTMAVSMDIEVMDGEIEKRYLEIKNCLITMEHFECNRLR